MSSLWSRLKGLAETPVNNGTTHWETCYDYGPRHYGCLARVAFTLIQERDEARAERDRANALLRECQPWADIASGDLGRRIDAHLRGGGEGR